ncbi:MAG TPA: hypothetical protein VF979_00210, partial [Streptosporangiaceae bacterium]
MTNLVAMTGNAPPDVGPWPLPSRSPGFAGSRVLGPGSTIPRGSRGHWRLFSAINSAARRGTSAADGRTIERIGWPAGTSGTP